MAGSAHSSSEYAELDDLSVAAYGVAVEFGRFDPENIRHRLSLTVPEVDRVEHVLRLLHLLQPMPGSPGMLVPVGPDVAAADLVGSAEHQIRDLQQAVTDVRTKLLSLMPGYFEGRRQRNRLEAFDVIHDTATIQSMTDHLTQHCRKELLTVQPGGARSSEALAAARGPALSTLARGVCIRTIYQHTARSDLATRSYVRDISAQGAAVRTADELIDRMIIYDRETVFLPQRDAESHTSGAAVVREPTLVAFLCAVFEHLWEGATPFTPESQSTSPRADDLQTSIIRLMAKGYKDEMVARRLGMSVRTCRRHISEITELLEATSRFQAGFKAALSGMGDAAESAG